MSFFSHVTLSWCLCSPQLCQSPFMEVGENHSLPPHPTPTPQEHCVIMNVFCVEKHLCSLRHTKTDTKTYTHTGKHIHTHTHTHAHTSTTKVLSLKWTSIRGRERCCHWGQKIAGGRYLDNTSEAKTVKNMDVDLLQVCAVHGLHCNTSRWTMKKQIDLIKDKWPWRNSCCEINKT